MNKRIEFDTKHFIFGKHACIAALNNPRRKIHKIYATKENYETLSENHKNKTKIIDNKDFEKFLPKSSAHQGIALEADKLASYTLNPKNFEENSKIVILDQITDSGNFGAIVRNAAAFGIKDLIVPSDNSAEETAAMLKASAGTFEQIRLYKVTNISSTIELLKKNDFWIIGLAGEASDELSPKILSGKAAIVLGAEGKGMRKLTKEKCDILAKISISNEVESLNVSSAATIAFYLASTS